MTTQEQEQPLDENGIAQVIQATQEAGRSVLEVYNRDFDVDTKEDQSPLTEADRRSHSLLTQELKKHFPHIPILSEEDDKQLAFTEREDWSRFWLIDPLDGTKEFIKKNGEFTINIALIQNNFPVLGVVLAPAKDLLYWGAEHESKSYRLKGKHVWSEASSIKEYAESLPLIGNMQEESLRVVASRSHMNQETEDFLNELQQESPGQKLEPISIGSSLKLCLVAEGSADVYPRLGPTMEWDTAAAHAVVNYAGKQVFDYDKMTPLIYNKEDLTNPWFVVR